jgi:DNA mismatch endonuclease (patch repair protein)
MQRQRQRDTQPELALRRAVHSLHLGYRVHVRPVDGLRRTADLVFASARVAVFVNGCFWHGCPEHRSPSKTNQDFWSRKVESNSSRDQDTDERLELAGWVSFRVWEHDDPVVAAAKIAAVVSERRGAGPRPPAGIRSAPVGPP